MSGGAEVQEIPLNTPIMWVLYNHDNKRTIPESVAPTNALCWERASIKTNLTKHQLRRDGWLPERFTPSLLIPIPRYERYYRSLDRLTLPPTDLKPSQRVYPPGDHPDDVDPSRFER